MPEGAQYIKKRNIYLTLGVPKCADFYTSLSHFEMQMESWNNYSPSLVP